MMLGWRGWEAGLHGVAGRRIWGDMGAAARAGRDAYARACLVDASERRLASRKSILREENQELHLWAPHWKTVARSWKKISGDQLELRAIGACSSKRCN